MRLKITMTKPNFLIPLAYQSKLQGLIYSLISRNELGTQYHDKGYDYKNRKFKCFVFSQLFGKYDVKNGCLVFKDDFYFYLSSQDEQFLKQIYEVLVENEFVILNNEKVKIKDICIFDLTPYQGVKELTIRTLSPILAYRTDGDFSSYYKPSDKESKDILMNNIIGKVNAYHYPLEQIVFDINSVSYEQKRMVKYKNCVYPSYLCEMNITADYKTLSVLYNMGIGSKNSCGFGMIEIKEKHDIPL